MDVDAKRISSRPKKPWIAILAGYDINDTRTPCPPAINSVQGGVSSASTGKARNDIPSVLCLVECQLLIMPEFYREFFCKSVNTSCFDQIPDGFLLDAVLKL